MGHYFWQIAPIGALSHSFHHSRVKILSIPKVSSLSWVASDIRRGFLIKNSYYGFLVICVQEASEFLMLVHVSRLIFLLWLRQILEPLRAYWFFLTECNRNCPLERRVWASLSQIEWAHSLGGSCRLKSIVDAISWWMEPNLNLIRIPKSLQSRLKLVNFGARDDRLPRLFMEIVNRIASFFKLLSCLIPCVKKILFLEIV
jgi:hypothetical protein